MENVSPPLICLKSRVRNFKPEISISGLLTPLKKDVRLCVRTYVTLWLAIQMTNRVLIGLQSGRRVNRSLNLRLRPQLPTVILTLSVCLVVWLQQQGPFYSSHKPLGFGSVPFLHIWSQHQISKVSSASNLVLHAANPITSIVCVHTPSVQPSNNLTYPTSNEPCPVGDSQEFDIEDEYSLNICNDFDHDKFTEDYFEFEQGQKDILVKNRLGHHINFWKEIGANQFILDTIFMDINFPFTLYHQDFCRKIKGQL